MEKNISVKEFLKDKNPIKVISDLKKVLKIKPNYSNYLFLAKIYFEIKYYDQCENLLNKIVKSKEIDFEYYYIIGNLYLEKKDYFKAIRYFIKSIKLNKNFTPSWINIAFLLKESGHFIFSERLINKILQKNKDNVRLKFNYAHVLLALKKFDEGFKFYEFRWFLKDLSSKFLLTNQSMPEYKFKKYLTPKNPSQLNGQSIIITQEGGLGDIFHFVRYLNLFPPSTKVFFATNKNMHKILSYNQTKFQVLDIENINIDNSVKFALPLLSLPLFFKKYEFTTDFYYPYLFTNKEIDQFWMDKVNKACNNQNCKIGICNEGGNNPLIGNKLNRSIDIKYFKEIFINNNLNFFNLSLKKNFDYPFYDNKIITFSSIDSNDKFVDTASIINSMDLILTVDTSIAHLSGALNKKTILLLNYIAEWRWGVNSEKTHWYDNLIIVRKKKFENWKNYFTRVNKKMLEEISCLNKN